MSTKIKYTVTIKGDTNDADYVTSTTKWTQAQYDANIERLKHVCAAIKKKRGEWPNHEYSDGNLYETYEDLLSKEDIEWFKSMCPRGENGIHSIDGVTITEIVSITELV